MDAVLGGIAVVIVAAVGGAVTWLVARRTKSGEIATSEAGELWDAQTEFRQELLARLQRAEDTTERLQATLQTCHERVQEAMAACSALHGGVSKAKAELAAVRHELDAKDREIAKMRREKS